jgi:uncharacterized membrane-anchored protein
MVVTTPEFAREHDRSLTSGRRREERSGGRQVGARNLSDMTPSAVWLPHRSGVARSLSQHTPGITPGFWVVLVLCAPLGDAGVDWLDGTLGLGLTYSTFLVAGVLVLALAVQLGAHHYLPLVHWTVAGLVRVTGTLVLADLTETLGVSPAIATAISVLLLVAVVAGWVASEQRDPSDRRREGLYWLTLLLCFVLGTAVSAQLRLGYAAAGIVVATLVTGSLLLVSVVALGRTDDEELRTRS